MTSILGFFENIGASILQGLAGIGRVVLFALQAIVNIFIPPFYGREFGRAVMNIGFLSLPVVGLTSIFTGAALALQIWSGGTRFNAESVVPFIVALGMVRELGPVLGGLMVAGRVSSSIAAEIGTMRVTEQIDALTTLSTNPIRYLVSPRILAATLVLPLLVGIGDILGIFGGYLVGTSRLGFDANAYIHNSFQYLQNWDIYSGLIKATVFGFLLSLMGCYCGYYSGRGAQGVGRATTYAVVTASVLILTANYVLTEAFFSS